jgi:hypothetical protein
MVAVAPRCTRLRAAFVIHRKTDFPKGPQAQPAALSFFGFGEQRNRKLEVKLRKRDVTAH